jgi:hypothetical protein
MFGNLLIFFHESSYGDNPSTRGAEKTAALVSDRMIRPAPLKGTATPAIIPPGRNS